MVVKTIPEPEMAQFVQEVKTRWPQATLIIDGKCVRTKLPKREAQELEEFFRLIRSLTRTVQPKHKFKPVQHKQGV